jgi:hypothetical protein
MFPVNLKKIESGHRLVDQLMKFVIMKCLKNLHYIKVRTLTMHAACIVFDIHVTQVTIIHKPYIEKLRCEVYAYDLQIMFTVCSK